MTEPTAETFLQKQLRKKAEREAAERPALPPVVSGTAAPVTADSPRAVAWVDAKRRALLQDITDAPEGTRNHTLNAAAYSLGRLCPTYLNTDDIAAELYQAALTVGLEPSEARATINSGLRSGMNEPRSVQLPDTPHTTTHGQRVDPLTGEIHPDPEPTLVPIDLEADDAALRLVLRERLKPLDWRELWADNTEEEWIVEPILPARRLVALYSAPKVGKSLLMLELAVAVSRGVTVLGITPDRPRRVLYVDFENDPKADVRERLQAMSVGPDQLSNLIYLSFPTLAALDSDRGGRELIATVREYGCEVVMVDTVSRSIAGEENENDTWLSFYRHTGLRLKQEGVALIRLDHSGKDETKGQRGGSAKSGDVDAVWRMSRISDDKYRLDCEAARMPVAERTLVLHRRQGPLRHQVDAEGRAAVTRLKVEALIKALDDLGAPRDIGRPAALQLVRSHGFKAGTELMAKALQKRSGAVPEWSGQHLENTLSPDGPGQARTAGGF